jgi:PqqD family protein of HPr-rel-A system
VEAVSKSFVATAGLETTALEDGAILFHPKSGKFVMLNRSAAVVWTELATPKTEEELAKKLAASFSDVAPATAQEDVHAVLERLRELDIVTATDG